MQLTKETLRTAEEESICPVRLQSNAQTKSLCCCSHLLSPTGEECGWAANMAFDLDGAWKQEWPHDFTLRITYTINASSLKMTAEVRAPTEDIKMALLFHTYLRVGDIKRTEIVGLQGLHYRPHAPDHAATTTEPGEVCFEQREIVTIAGPTDRVYLDHAAGRLVEVIDAAEYGPLCNRILCSLSR